MCHAWIYYTLSLISQNKHFKLWRGGLLSERWWSRQLQALISLKNYQITNHRPAKIISKRSGNQLKIYSNEVNAQRRKGHIQNYRKFPGALTHLCTSSSMSLHNFLHRGQEEVAYLRMLRQLYQNNINTQLTT